jgi:peptidoglycan/LPS O-acetylase OafA/YrhL
MERPRKLDCLDGLRGLAVLLVILFHYRLMGESAPHFTMFYRAFAPFRFAYSGVHLFLVLSGFCLTHSLLRRIRAGPEVTLASYMRNRLWRIGPPYFAAIIVCLAFTSLVGSFGYRVGPSIPIDLRQLIIHGLFLHGYWPDTIQAINPPFWSLSLEFQFYLTLPLLFALAFRFGPARILGCVALLSLAWRVLVFYAMPDLMHLANGFFLGRWAEFTVGMTIAFWYNHPKRQPTSPRRGDLTVVLSGLFLLAAFGLAAAQKHLIVDFLFGAAYGALLVAVLISSDHGGWLARCVTLRPLVQVGVISYSLYLTHNLLLDWGTKAYRRCVTEPTSAADAMALCALIALVIAAGWGFYAAFESRFVRSVDRGVPPKPA